MDYIVILDYGTKNHSVIQDDNGFIKTFSNYQKALDEAEEYIKHRDCRTAEVFSNKN